MRISYNEINKNKILILSIIFMIALTLRLISVVLFPQFAWDSGEYTSLAHNILANQNFTFDGRMPVDSRAPLYPAFIAGIYYFAGESNFAVRIIQSLIDTITCFYIYFIALVFWESILVAIIAALIASLYPSLIGSTTFILSETLSVHLLTGSILSFIYALKIKKYRYFLLSGIILGLATLCRPVTFLYPFILALIFAPFSYKNKNLMRGLFVFVICFVLTLLPWILRNAYHFKRFIPVSSNVGGNLWIGSYEPWNGSYHPDIMKIRSDIGSKLYKGKIGHFYVDDHLKRDALERIIKDPLVYLKLCVKKTLQFWGRIPGEIAILDGRPFIKLLIYLHHYSMLILFITGVIMIIHAHRINLMHIVPLSLIVYVTGIHAALVALPRYRIPIIPMLIIFISYGSFHILACLFKDKVSNTSRAL